MGDINGRSLNVVVRENDGLHNIVIEGLNSDAFLIRDEISAFLSKKSDSFAATPGHWSKHSVQQGALQVKVSSVTAEYNEIKQLFLQSIASYRTTDIEVYRVQNLQLHKMYEAYKEKVTQEVGGAEVKERRLWHGTDGASAQSICQSEFNRSYAKSCSFGQGANFSTTSNYSLGYSRDSGVKSIILAKVMTGRFTPGNSGTNRTNLPAGFRSTVDNMANPTIFVVYHDASAYPEYLVKFRCL